MPSIGWPTEPKRVAPGRLVVTMHEVSLMPHTSQIGMPSAAKNSSTSTGVGAAPTASQRAWSSPRRSLAAASGAQRRGARGLERRLELLPHARDAAEAVGRTWATTAMTCVGSATGVTVWP